MRSRISFLESERIPIVSIEHDSYMFRKDKSLVWLQKVLFFILKKIGAYSINTTYEVKRYIVEPSRFVDELLFKMKKELANTFNMCPNKMYIGADDYSDLMADPGFRQLMYPITFDTSYNYGRNVMGLEVHIIPWMSGILLVKENK